LDNLSYVLENELNTEMSSRFELFKNELRRTGGNINNKLLEYIDNIKDARRRIIYPLLMDINESDAYPDNSMPFGTLLTIIKQITDDEIKRRLIRVLRIPLDNELIGLLHDD
jgi:hypothetical protein